MSDTHEDPEPQLVRPYVPAALNRPGNGDPGNGPTAELIISACRVCERPFSDDPEPREAIARYEAEHTDQMPGHDKFVHFTRTVTDN